MNNKTEFTVPLHLAAPDSWVKHIPFAFYLIALVQPKRVVELGTFSGNSFFAMCQAVKQKNYTCELNAVDTWQGDEHTGGYDNSVFESVRKHQEEHYPYAELLRMRFEEAILQFEDKSVDILHIDGLHTYEAVKADFTTWLPKMSDSGIILFHDTTVKEKDFGVWKLWDEIKGEYPSFNFEYGYGLGVLLVGKSIDEKVSSALLQFRTNKLKVNYYQALGEKIQILFEYRTEQERNKELQKQLQQTNTILDEIKATKSFRLVTKLQNALRSL